MLASYAWRLDARLWGGGGRRWVPLGVRRMVRKLVVRLGEGVPDGVMVSRHPRDPAGLLVFGRTRREVEAVRTRLESSLTAAGITSAAIAIDHWSDRENQWRQDDGPVDRELGMGRHGVDDEEFRFHARLAGLAVAIALAVGAVALYVTTPYTFPATQIAVFGTLPLVLVVLVWLHRRLPMWIQWVVAVVVFPMGLVGYLVFGGAQWWLWGQLTAVPFLLLVFGRASGQQDDDASWGDPVFVPPQMGPFGPP
jgi:hypothetical protein